MKAKKILKESRKRLRKRGVFLIPEDRKKIEQQVEQLEKALSKIVEPEVYQNGERRKTAKVQARKAATQLRNTVAKKLPKKRLEIFLEYVVSLGLAVLIAMTIRHFIAEPFRIPTGSMIPTLRPGDYILVNKARYGPRIPFTAIKPFGSYKPERWDIVVFTTKGLTKASQYPKNYVKRVVGLPGDKLRIANGEIYVNGKHVRKPKYMKKKRIPYAVVQFDSASYYLDRPPGRNNRKLPEKPRIINGRIHVGEEELPFDPLPSGSNLPLEVADDGRTILLKGVYYFTIPQDQKCHIEMWDYWINILDFHFFKKKDTKRTNDDEDAVRRNEDDEYVVPEGMYFMMGDNSAMSSDSRYWGYVPYRNIKGKVILKAWPPSRWGVPE